ncbi:MAG: HAMP domain-containing protein [Candidatus Aminicenantes bacterium]|nr:HAMP domain-containing protein [Candidatus Aminicenantes bacterium]
MLSVIALLCLLASLILFVIEKREVKAIYEEQRNIGIVIAKNIANMIYSQLLVWDEEGTEESIEAEVDEKLIYIVIYDRFRSPFTATRFIKEYDEIYSFSLLGQQVDENSYFSERKRLVDQESGQILRILEVEVPIFVKGSPDRWGSIKIGLSLEETRKEMRETRLMLILIGSVGLLIGVLGALLLAKRITGPLKKLVEATVKISKGHFSQRINITSQDEIGNLARSFNKMSRQLLQARKKEEAANQKLIQAEKLASIGRISAGIAHEIRNPLTSVKLNIQKLMQSDNLDEVEKEHLNISQEGIKYMEKSIKDLLDFTRASELELARFSIEQILEESVKTLADSLALKKVTLKRNFRDELPQVLVDGDKLRQVFLNILRNAYEAVDEGGEITISLSLLKERFRKIIKVVISDNGCGIPDKERDVIFELFYTTKTTGIGLGLAIARKIIEQHNGSIQLSENAKKGTSFEILIPVEAPQ